MSLEQMVRIKGHFTGVHVSFFSPSARGSTTLGDHFVGGFFFQARPKMVVLYVSGITCELIIVVISACEGFSVYDLC